MICWTFIFILLSGIQFSCEKKYFNDGGGGKESEEKKNSFRSIYGGTASGSGLTRKKKDTDRENLFLRRLFQKYGNDGVMTFEGFEHLLENIGLGNVQITDHDVHDHHTDDGFMEFHPDHGHNDTDERTQLQDTGNAYPASNSSTGESSVNRRRSYRHEWLTKTKKKKRKKGKTIQIKNQIESDSESTDRPEEEIDKRLKRAAIVEKKCASASEILRAFRIQNKDGINQFEFVSLCPAIVYQLDEHVCHAHDAPCHRDNRHGDKEAHCLKYHRQSRQNETNEENENETTFFKVSWKSWCFALMAVAIISLVGLGGVAVIPIMDKIFYNHLLQFLIALAIGTLTGDALLHLLPHAMVPHHSHSSSDNYCDDKTTSSSSATDDHDDDDDGEGFAVWIGFVSLLGIFLFFVTERILSTLTEKKRITKQRQLESVDGKEDETKVGKKLSQHSNTRLSTARDYTSGFLENVDFQLNDDMKRENFELIASHDRNPIDQMKEKEIKVLNPDHDDDDDHVTAVAAAGHGHGHGHSHQVPNSVSSAAWMVIMGDGLHNFTDGLAIGASFANSLAVGLSTTVAVFCHELPHELGDFAVLLKAGMTIRQALVYNIISSVLCFFGMAIGVVIGNMESTTNWIFSVTAGIFLYIALVDMLPQLFSRDGNKSNELLMLLLHICGIVFGIGIMLLVALYEKRIQISVDISP